MESLNKKRKKKGSENIIERWHCCKHQILHIRLWLFPFTQLFASVFPSGWRWKVSVPWWSLWCSPLACGSSWLSPNEHHWEKVNGSWCPQRARLGDPGDSLVPGVYPVLTKLCSEQLYRRKHGNHSGCKPDSQRVAGAGHHGHPQVQPQELPYHLCQC